MIKMLRLLAKILPSRPVYAHCDIPCGIYDPKPAQIAAQTVQKMVEKIQALPDDNSLTTRNNFARMVAVKEEHSDKCEEEVLILWTDYFKPEHFQRWPDLTDKVRAISALCSKNRQNVDLQAAQDLLAAVDDLAKIFEEAKKPA
jgi:nickel superoxide dismutase